jgi:uncharacterized repeat protein (TIGR01451 family)
MKIFSKQQKGWALGVLLGLGGLGVAHAQDSTPVTVTSAVFQEVVVASADGTTSTKLEPATRVAPGGVVVYEISYHNGGSQAASDVAINNPLPQELRYLDASVEPSAVSVDGGKHFAPLAQLTIAGADGATRPAQPADVTNLRWMIASVAPEGSGKVSFRAQVK